MVNKEFQGILSQYPDDYEICIDNVFGWEDISIHNLVDPHLYINTDIGQIEIEPSDGYRNPWHKIHSDKEIGKNKPIDLKEIIARKWYDGWRYSVGQYNKITDSVAVLDGYEVVIYNLDAFDEWMYLPDDMED